ARLHRAERHALPGFLAGYRGLTRDAYALDMRQFTSWCRARSLPLFAVRRADIDESFARELEARGHARATVTRRLCTIAGFCKYAVEDELLEHSPAARSPPAGGRRVSCRRPGPQRARRAARRRWAWSAVRACADLAARAERGCGSGRPPARTSSSWAWSAATGP
ncbi:MAG: site-specific integrase, partial [Actinobacteria bacterium]|nr:site-specific integrase [Actinomycetota bacterium]